MLILTQNSIFVRTERPAYHGGDTVNGTVFLNLVSPVQSKGIFLKVKGYEKVFWTEMRTRQQGDRIEMYEEEIRGDHAFFKVHLPLFGAGGQFSAGQFAFPFSFVLPPGLPGVFHEKGHKFEARTRFKVKAECDVAGLLKPDIKNTQDLIVHEKPVGEIQPVIGEKSSNVMLLCCINKGTGTLRAHFDKLIYTPGETVQVICEIINDSSQPFTNMTTKLMRRLTVRHGMAQNSRVETLIEQKYPGVQPGEKLVGDAARSIPIVLKTGVQPQTHGRMITCDYWLDIEAEISMAPDIEIHMPIALYANAPTQEQWSAFQFPSGWAPQQQQVAALNIAPPVSGGWVAGH